MKATLYSSSGEKKSQIELPELFNSQIRDDIASKFFEAEKEVQPYAPYLEAGKRHVASGIASHRRHKWKTAYGKGIARTPRKIMWRRGTQFYWIGAEVANTRGGRRAHPPKLNHSPRKINTKEVQIAMNSAIAATANKDLVVSRYATMKSVEAPAVIESLPTKTKQTIESLRKIFADNFALVLKNKEVRAGKGKLRGRKYKSNAGLLLVVGDDEDVKLTGVDVVSVSDLRISDLYPLGRLTLYTKKAISELGSENKEAKK